MGDPHLALITCPVVTDGNPYGISEGLIFSMPCRSNGDGNYEIVEDFVIDDWLA